MNLMWTPCYLIQELEYQKKSSKMSTICIGAVSFKKTVKILNETILFASNNENLSYIVDIFYVEKHTQPIK